jgi:hypothetical protein
MLALIMYSCAHSLGLKRVGKGYGPLDLEIGPREAVLMIGGELDLVMVGYGGLTLHR